jgi:hypothetical protein
VLNDRDVVEPVKRARLETSHRLLRVIAKLAENGRRDDVARLYTETGTVVHENDQPFDDATVAHVLRETGMDDCGSALDDTALDAIVEASTAAALAAAGPGVGSPVLLLAGAERGLYGPVLGAVPDKAESMALWDAIEALTPIKAFLEVKRGRP